ncbi:MULTISPECIES: pilus assembly protein [Pseudomonas syringae group]|uniref:Type IV pilus-associated protein n=2 Tax=Pseudomonas syringae group TaxID=136849 RepID=A0A0P9YWK8_PSESI|nr:MULTISPECIES: PilC/PilY family type IV pilus protein [Pseudomonas syringae group]EKN45592.1 type IV pilus-associated protein [Pseudomonas viridiflava UASWS0038]KPL66408.1 pilus assembly protein [Pseudomonas viridiflava]KPY50577.1 Type IV pilus-associated protein [Pseudomonas syringae pv. ribicola]KPZ25397.1 Type IV pilus-associated protein [Pseudomonas viridiflava]OAG90261.1 pilus assembly protein [Pseudomonas viridiflava]
MPTAKAFRHALKYVYGVLLTLYLAAPVYAFTPAQVPLLSSSAVPPNLMLLVDNSGSMYNIIWASGFDPNVNRPDIQFYSTQCVSGLITVPCPFISTISGGETLAVGDINATGVAGISLSCLFGGRTIFRNGVRYCVVLPDPAGNGLTRYTADYLSYLIDLVTPGLFDFGVRDYTNGIIPNDFRMNVAKTVATNLVSNNLTLRIGLATFNEPNNFDLGPGGRISRLVTDLSPVTASTYQPAVTQAQATANVNALKQAIANLTPSANTPLAETYYEITRYFRGMAPFYQSAANYVSPIQYRCQKNYGVVVTDGLPTYDRTFPANDPEDVADTTRSLPNWDLNAANDGNNLSGDGEGDTLYLDDLAKFAYDIDLRRDVSAPGGDLTGKSWDTAGFPKQNLSTYTIGFTANNQMLIDAANDTHGRGKYFQANDSSGLNTALNLALSDIYAKAGSGGGGAANSATLQTGTRFFQTLYDPADWHGTINAFDLDARTGDPGAAVWTTDTTITSSSTAPTFETWNTAAATPTAARIALDFNALSQPQKDAVTATLPAGVTGIQLINWAKGTANAALRTRTRLLGDLINTNLAVALPTEKTSTDMAGSTSYSTYLSAKASNMTYSLLANANDGFLNVIGADNGRRTYAYMPSTALTSLATVASPNYGLGVHRFTADGQISVFDTQAGSSASWRTVAVSGLGAGGKAFFAIKLFEGTSNNISALWEVRAPAVSTPANGFNNLGFSYSKAEAARMADGTGIVVVGNGYGSFTGRASLFVLNANTGALIAEIPTPVTGSETDNGLSSVRLRVNAQNIVQAAYAGDLKGRLWKFDLSGASANSWKLAFNGQPLFTAPLGANQPITVQPLILDHPLNGKIIYFGTGKFLETADKQTTALQDFYAIWDADTASGNYVEGNLQAQAVTGSVSGSDATYFTSTANDVDWASKKGWFLPLSTIEPYIGERIIYPAQTSRGRILFTTAAVNSSDPCESTGTGRLFELDAATGSMLNYQVLDTNGDLDVNELDTRVSGRAVGSGIPILASVLAGTVSLGTDSNGNPKVPEDRKILIDSSGNKIVFPEDSSSGARNAFQRIMWRQIQ